MPSPRLSRTVESLLAKRGSAKKKAAARVEPSASAVESPSTPTTTTSAVEPGKPETSSGASFSASSTLPAFKSDTSESSVPSKRDEVSPRTLSDYDLGSPNGIAETLPADLQPRIEKLRQYWGAETADMVVDHIILVCLHTQGDWREKRVDTLVRTYLDAVGLV